MGSLISVIVPVYNTEAYLERCVKSIINQTYHDLEIILVDDGSTDQCPFLCDAWAEKDRRIHVLHKENGGVSSARNAGLKVAAGDWISFVDSDDWIHPRFYEILMRLAAESAPDVVAANHWRTEDDQMPDDIYIDQPEYRIISGENILNNWDSRFFVWGKVYVKSIISGHTFDESMPYGEDILFNIEVMCRADVKIIFTTEKLYYYYIRPGSAVSNGKQKKRVALCKAYLKHAGSEKKAHVKRVYLESAIRRALSTRYDAGFKSESKEIISECNNCMKAALKTVRPWKGSIHMYCMYLILYRFPIAYRLFRMKTDSALFTRRKK